MHIFGNRAGQSGRMRLSGADAAGRKADGAVFESDLERPRRVASDAFGMAKKTVGKMVLAPEKPNQDVQGCLRGMCGHGRGIVHAPKPKPKEASRLALGEIGATVFDVQGFPCLDALMKSVDSWGYALHTAAIVENAGFSRRGVLGFRREEGDYRGIGRHLNGLAVRHAGTRCIAGLENGALELMNGLVDTKHGDYCFRFFACNFWRDGRTVRCDYYIVIGGNRLDTGALEGMLARGTPPEQRLRKEFEKMGAAARRMFPSELWGRVRLENVICR